MRKILRMLDLSAAYDSVDHDTLLKKLEVEFGVKNQPLNWFRSYLSDRFRQVTFNSV